MRSLLFVGIFICINCRSGNDGAQGPMGERGLTGATGSQGTCDSSVCPNLSSIDGLSGGSLTSTLSTPQVTTNDVTFRGGSVSEARGVVVQRGSLSTSVMGFYCGLTPDSWGNAHGAATPLSIATADNLGIYLAKRGCEAACSNAAAHICTTNEVVKWFELGGRTKNSWTTADDRFPNPQIPLPPDESRAWILSSDLISSCNYLQDEMSTSTGILFRMAGDFGILSKVPCNEQHPLLCCL
jgi:hypothetical protein